MRELGLELWGQVRLKMLVIFWSINLDSGQGSDGLDLIIASACEHDNKEMYVNDGDGNDQEDDRLTILPFIWTSTV
jgi:hypothetical protein